ncbi:MAG: type II toxin-antitoxin system YafQ family toxin [Patescibacteria group bacterium]
MEFRKSSVFDKSFGKRILGHASLEKKFKERASLFLLDRTNPVLKDHKLSGKKEGLRAFSITGDIRIIYTRVTENLALFLDIGSHNQVYK